MFLHDYLLACEISTVRKFKDYPTHECVNSHTTSVKVYLLTS